MKGHSLRTTDYYANTLRMYQLKATPQRSAIAEALDHYGHLSIDALYEQLKQKLPSLSLATIYKNLHAMIEKNFVAEVKLPGAKSVFELVKEQHSHLLCEKCGMVEDIHMDVDPMIIDAQERSGFTIEKIDIVLTGRCSKCK